MITSYLCGESFDIVENLMNIFNDVLPVNQIGLTWLSSEGDVKN